MICGDIRVEPSGARYRATLDEHTVLGMALKHAFTSDHAVWNVVGDTQFIDLGTI